MYLSLHCIRFAFLPKEHISRRFCLIDLCNKSITQDEKVFHNHRLHFQHSPSSLIKKRRMGKKHFNLCNGEHQSYENFYYLCFPFTSDHLFYILSVVFSLFDLLLFVLSWTLQPVVAWGERKDGGRHNGQWQEWCVPDQITLSRFSSDATS